MVQQNIIEEKVHENNITPWFPDIKLCWSAKQYTAEQLWKSI